MRRVTQLIALFVLFVLTGTPSQVDAQFVDKLRVAYTVIGPTQSTVWTAKEMGFYAKHGLDVEMVLLVGAPLAVTAMLAGETPIVHTGASAVITATSPVPAPCWRRGRSIAFPTCFSPPIRSSASKT